VPAERNTNVHSDSKPQRAIHRPIQPKFPNGGRVEDSFLQQHIRELATDHKAGVFADTNDLIETIGGRPSMSLEAFIEKHRNAFE